MKRKRWALIAGLFLTLSLLLTACGAVATPTTAPAPAAAATDTPAAAAAATNTTAPAAAGTDTPAMAGTTPTTASAVGTDTPAMAGTTPTTAASSGGSAAGKKVVVSSKNFTEEEIIGEMYALMLEQAGIPVERKLNLGTADIAQAALVKGDISLYPEYTGTGLTVILKQDVMNDDKAVYDKVKQMYEDQFKLTWLDQSPMNDTQ